MRRLAQFVLLVALVCAVAAAVSGVSLLRTPRGDVNRGLEHARDTGSLRVVHALAGHVTAACVGLLGSACFVLGFHGLLGGRRLAALLLMVSPLLMGAALATEASGWLAGRAWRGPGSASAVGAPGRYVELHSLQVTSVLLGSLLAAAVLTTWLARPAPVEQDDGDED